MSPKPDVAAERKEQIFAAAMTCFNRKGYHQTTMDEIVAESGLSKGALYWYFDSKKALFMALFQFFIDSLGHEWEAIVYDEALTATAKLTASLDFFRKQFNEMIDFFGVVMEAWALTHVDEDVQLLTQEFYKPYLAYMDHILNEGVARGEFTVENVRATSAVLLTMVDGLTLAVGGGLLDFDQEELFDAAASLVLRGLGAEV